MITEQDLHAMRDPDATPCRAVEAVLARGARLRRRRLALHVTTVSGIMGVGAVTAGLLVFDGKKRGDVEVEAVGEPSTTTSESPSPPPACEPGESTRETLPPSEVPDDLRLFPEWTPNDDAVITTTGSGSTDPCPKPADIALSLRGGGDAMIALGGPYGPRTVDHRLGAQEETELRGVDATFVRLPDDLGVSFTWTEPDGWSWGLQGFGGVDEATVRAVAEALELNSFPEGDEPVAALAAEDLPAGLEVAEQAVGPPAFVDTSVTWAIEVGDVEDSFSCTVEVTRRAGEPVGSSDPDTGSVTVNGKDATWAPDAISTEDVAMGTLTWVVSPAVVAKAMCGAWGGHPLDVETVVRFAESVAPVAADDSRLAG